MSALQAGNDINMNVVWTALSLVLTRCFQVWAAGIGARGGGRPARFWDIDAEDSRLDQGLGELRGVCQALVSVFVIFRSLLPCLPAALGACVDGSARPVVLSQVYSSAQTEKATMQQKMSAQLYDKMLDSQEGVVSVITEEMASQQYKQMLCAYMTLIVKVRAPFCARVCTCLDGLTVACPRWKQFDATQSRAGSLPAPTKNWLAWPSIRSPAQNPGQLASQDVVAQTCPKPWATTPPACRARQCPWRSWMRRSRTSLSAISTIRLISRCASCPALPSALVFCEAWTGWQAARLSCPVTTAPAFSCRASRPCPCCVTHRWRTHCLAYSAGASFPKITRAS